MPLFTILVLHSIDPHLAFSNRISNLSALAVVTSAASNPSCTLKLPTPLPLHRPLKPRLLQVHPAQPRLHPSKAFSSLSKTHLHGLLPERPGIIIIHIHIFVSSEKAA